MSLLGYGKEEMAIMIARTGIFTDIYHLPGSNYAESMLGFTQLFLAYYDYVKNFGHSA